MPPPAPVETPILALPVALIEEHPANPRISTWGLEELVDSIRQLGVLTPCIVREVGDESSKGFQLLAGHRRFRAVQQLGWESLPCRIVTASNSAAWKILLAENLQRRNLNVIEEARAFQKMREAGMTILAIAGVLNCSEQRVSRRLALLELPAEIQGQVLTKDLSLSEAWNLVTEQREDAAHARRGPRKGEGTGRNSKWHAHFNQHHPLHSEAEKICDEAGHTVVSRLGPACGACWEEAIRDDQHLTSWWEFADGGIDDDDQGAPPRIKETA